MLKASDKKKSPNEISEFSHISWKEIKCMKCGCIGHHGQVSGKFFNFLTILGIISLLLGTFTSIIGFWGWITSPIAIMVGILMHNKFKCPECGLISAPLSPAKVNPLYKNIKI